MNKQKILNVIDIISYIAIINATVFVLLFQYGSSRNSLNFALFSYIVAFFAMALFGVMRIIFSSNKESNDEFVLSKKQKIWLIVKIILSIILLAFSTLILILS